mgnify:FL=1
MEGVEVQALRLLLKYHHIKIMKKYIYIKEGYISLISDELIAKKTDEQDWMVYDEVITTTKPGPYEYIDWVIQTKIIEIVKTKEDKKNEILNTQDIQSIDLEWFEFSDIEIGDIITARVFGWNPYAQQALTTKVIWILLAWGPQTESDNEILARANALRTAINEIRSVFNLDQL